MAFLLVLGLMADPSLAMALNFQEPSFIGSSGAIPVSRPDIFCEEALGERIAAAVLEGKTENSVPHRAVHQLVSSLAASQVPRAGYRFQSASKPIPGSTLIIGDLDGHYDRLQGLAHDAGYTTANGAWSAGNATLIQMGDIAARSPNSLKAWQALSRLQRDALAAGGRVVRLVGNHEWKIMSNQAEPMDIQAMGIKPAQKLGALIREDMAEGRVQAALAVGEFLITHAGIQKRLWSELYRRVTDRIGHQRPSAQEIANYLNTMAVAYARGENPRELGFVKGAVGVGWYAQPGSPLFSGPAQITAHNIVDDILPIDDQGWIIAVDVGNGEERGRLGYLTLDPSGKDAQSVLLHEDGRRVIKNLYRADVQNGHPHFSFVPIDESAGHDVRPWYQRVMTRRASRDFEIEKGPLRAATVAPIPIRTPLLYAA